MTDYPLWDDPMPLIRIGPSAQQSTRRRKVRVLDMEKPCALTLEDLPSPCPRCQATEDGKHGECPCDD